MEKVRVLLLDSVEEEREKTKEFLLENERVELVDCLDDGEKGFEVICRENVDFVVTDVVLQTYDGYELLEQISTLENKPKVLMLSSLKNDGFAQKAINLGAVYYMVKPVTKEVFLKRFNYFVTRDDERLSRSPRNRALEERISNIFITVGIPAHIKGYQFLREAIKMAIVDPDIINSITKQLYPSIANRFSTSASKVERAIRHAIEVAWNRGKIENINNIFGIKVYDSNEKPTNGEFIALVADKMLVEGA
jgi:two-component system response regulator (stage 0 sporulation protein A)